jgi:hypothetical protein
MARISGQITEKPDRFAYLDEVLKALPAAAEQQKYA